VAASVSRLEAERDARDYAELRARGLLGGSGRALTGG
jgi:hypothetical protein